MSWEDQGRQAHGWFGNGRTPDGNHDTRIDAIAHAAIASMPARVRGHSSASFDRHSLGQLRTAMTVWMNARTLDQASFADRLLDPSVPRAAVVGLRVAADVARNARSPRELAQGSAALADAMTGIGLDRWPRILRDAAQRAEADQASVDQVAFVEQANTAATTATAELPPPLTGQELADYRAKFDQATTIAYQRYSHDCSHYLHEHLVQMSHPEIPYMTANRFVDYARSTGSGWQEVTAEDAVRLSAEGHIVVAGLADHGGHGHVAVVGPQWIARSTRDGMLKSPQLYGGAMGNYDGARSTGQNSVVDAWRRQDRDKVTYWMKQ
jgi:hypothetical protein